MPDAAPVSLAPALSWPVRTVAGLAGAAAVVFGVLAIFRNHDGAAAAVLLVIGAAFALMAVTGYAITRIKAGDYEITLEVADRRGAPWDEDGGRYLLANMGQPARELGLALGRTSYAVYLRRRKLRGRLETETGKVKRRIRRGERV